MEFIFTLHSHFRWIALLSAALVLAKYVASFISKKEFSKLDRILGSIFVSVIDIQLILGLILLITRISAGAFSGRIAEHITTMIISVVLAHLPIKWRTSESHTRLRNTLLCYLGAIILILMGIIRMRGALA